MNLIIYIYPELFFFCGFLFYFIYNIFSYSNLSIVNIFLGKLFVVEKMSSFLRLTQINELYVAFKLALEKRIMYKKLVYIVSEKNSFFYISLFCFFTMCLYCYQLFWFLDSNDIINGKVYLLGSVYIVDTFSIFLKILITFVSFFFFIISYHVSSFWRYYGFEFGFFIFMVIFSMLILVSASDFFLVFVSLEVQTLSIVILASYQVSQKRSIEAGLKYFIFSSFFSGIFLFSIALLYFVFGLVSFEGIYQLTLGGTSGDSARDVVYMVSIVLVSSLIFFKLGIFPYHYWIADVYQGSNLVVTTFLAIISKIGLVGVFIRLYLTVFINFSFFWSNFVYYISIISMLFGAIAALYQIDIKRFLAYTSISNMGYTLVAFSIGNFDGMLYGMLYFIGYIFATLCFFLIVLGLVKKDVASLENKDNFSNILHDFDYLSSLNDLQGLYRNNKVLAFGVLLVLLNLLGMPPLFFFFSKYFIFDSFLRYNYFLAVFAFVVTNLISAFYYLRVVRIIFLDRVVSNRLFYFSSIKLTLIFSFFLFLTIILMIHPLFLVYVIDFLSLVLSRFYF